MDHSDPKPVLPKAVEPVDEAALDAFIRGPDFDKFLLDCFEEGIREAVAADEALLKQHTSAA